MLELFKIGRVVHMNSGGSFRGQGERNTAE